MTRSRAAALASILAPILAFGPGWPDAAAHAQTLTPAETPAEAPAEAPPGAMTQAQADDDRGAITARVHGTFQDAAGGLGVLSGDMLIVRFEVRNGAVAAVGRIVGALADSTGNVLGRVQHELILPVARVESTCN